MHSKSTHPSTNIPTPALPKPTTPNDNPPDLSARRLKKREADRRCQRAARERTRSRIAALEALVEDLRRQDSSQQVAGLLQKLSHLSNDRDRLARALGSIEAAVKKSKVEAEEAAGAGGEGDGDGGGDGDRGFPGSGSLNLGTFTDSRMRPGDVEVDVDVDFDSPDSLVDLAMLEQSVTGENWPENGILEQNGGELDTGTIPTSQAELHMDSCMTSTGYNSWALSAPTMPQDLLAPPAPPVQSAPAVECECGQFKHNLQTADGKSLWQFTNETLHESYTLHPDIIRLEEALAEDIPVRAVELGWPAVEARMNGKLPPLWRKLRRNDEKLFASCGKKERLAILRMMHMMMLYHADPTPERRAMIPAWYLPRPSQSMAHSYAVNFFAWPGIRERFVFAEHRYCSNTFWRLFAGSLQVLWPYEFRDCYTLNTETGRFKTSPTFEQRIGDLNAWTMTGDIFQRWPEFYADIPASNSLARCVVSAPLPASGGGESWWGCGGQTTVQIEAAETEAEKERRASHQGVQMAFTCV
ncbi:hypothetical protein K402DRAFT_119695 [Aulographum hederae CBS 113979]|uniref:BZIP domain-containing protein n=1 Tax=Aulographum hederae CBS 113979 TaxID=1176131 RepID=A0A6G1GVL9_9PEZI|nr:hypothetical protein K402DRAFT_119695 [Aulographum hederae CBS 113979]